MAVVNVSRLPVAFGGEIVIFVGEDFGSKVHYFILVHCAFSALIGLDSATYILQHICSISITPVGFRNAVW